MVAWVPGQGCVHLGGNEVLWLRQAGACREAGGRACLVCLSRAPSPWLAAAWWPLCRRTRAPRSPSSTTCRCRPARWTTTCSSRWGLAPQARPCCLGVRGAQLVAAFAGRQRTRGQVVCLQGSRGQPSPQPLAPALPTHPTPLRTALRRALLADGGCGGPQPCAAGAPRAGTPRRRTPRPARPGGGRRPSRRRCTLACCACWAACLHRRRGVRACGSCCRACGLPAILSAGPCLCAECWHWRLGACRPRLGGTLRFQTNLASNLTSYTVSNDLQEAGGE